MISVVRPGLLALCLAGCASPAAHSPAPQPVNYPSQVQRKMQAVAHWHAQAEALSRDIVAAMSKDPVLWPAPLHVEMPQKASEFERSLARMLASDLVSAGMTLAVEPNGGYPVTVEARLIEFGGARRANPPVSSGEHRAELAAGGVPRSEVLVTVTVANENRYLFRATQVLYARDQDRRLYARPVAPKPPSAKAVPPSRLVDVLREYEGRRAPLNP